MIVRFFTASELKAIQDGNYFDWVDAVSSPAFMTNHTISATGGNEMATYALSAGYYFEDGMLEPQEYSRYNLRAVVDVEPSKYMKFGINMYGPIQYVIRVTLTCYRMLFVCVRLIIRLIW